VSVHGVQDCVRCSGMNCLDCKGQVGQCVLLHEDLYCYVVVALTAMYSLQGRRIAGASQTLGPTPPRLSLPRA
jgi:hypothetical protein